MNVDHDAPVRNIRVLTKWRMRDETVRRGFPEGAVHVDAVEAETRGIGHAGALAQLRHKHDASSHLAGVEIGAEALDSHLAFVFIAVRTAEADHAVPVWSRGFAIDHRQRNERVAPGSIQVKGDLVMMLARRSKSMSSKL